jgi:peptidylprolyl isomerase
MENGDFVKIKFEMRVGSDKQLVATSDEALAKENNIYDPDQKYGEGVLVVGSEDLFKEINDSLLSSKIGEEHEVEIKAENAYGMRDSKNLKVHTMSEFKRNNIDPVPGAEVRINNKRGRILSVSPGRVVVDYNHPWAGKDVFYKYSLVEKLDGKKEILKGIIDLNFSRGSDKFVIEERENDLEITVPEDMKFNIEWFDAKYRVVEATRKYLKDLVIYITEKYEPVKEEVKEDDKQEIPAKEETADKENEKNVSAQ